VTVTLGLFNVPIKFFEIIKIVICNLVWVIIGAKPNYKIEKLRKLNLIKMTVKNQPFL